MRLTKTRPLSLRQGTPRKVAMAAVTILVAVSIGATVLTILAERPHARLHLASGWLCLSVAGFLAAALTQAELWRRLVAALGSRMQPLDGLAVWCVSALARYVPTSLLMPMVRMSMSRARDVPVNICAASLVYEAAFAVAGALWVASCFLIGLPALSGAAWRWGVLLLPLACMFALHPSGVRLISPRLLRRLRQDPLPVYLSVKRLTAFTAGYVTNFLLSGASLVALILAFYALPLEDVPIAIGAFAIGFAASTFGFILPAGLGAREAALVGALSLVMPTFVAATVAVGSRLIQISLELLVALIAPWLALRGRTRAVAALNESHGRSA